MNKRIVILFLVSSFFSSIIFSQTPPPTETIGGTIQQKKQFEKERALELKIKQPKKEDQEGQAPEVILEDQGEKV